MANPQKKDGYTPIAHTILEALSTHVISPDEWRVLMVILRKTYGWDKKEDHISHTQLSNITHISRNHIPRIINKLITRNIIYKSVPHSGDSVPQTGYINITTYGFQKDFDKWVRCPPIRGLSPKQDLGVPQSGDGVFSLINDKSMNPKGIPEKKGVSPKQGHTKDNYIKENIQKKGRTILMADEDFWKEVRKIYMGVDIDREIQKMKGHMLSPKGKRSGWRMTQQRVIEWLNRIDKPLELPKPKIENDYPRAEDVLKRQGFTEEDFTWKNPK